MKKYFIIAKSTFMSGAMYRFPFIFTSVSNIIYITAVYFLWKAIYSSSGDAIIRGMSFQQAFVYVALSSSLLCLFQTSVEREIGWNIISGNIIMDVMKPMEYQYHIFARTFGRIINNFVMITLPTFVLLVIIFKVSIPIGLNIPLFFLAITIAFLISFCIDFIVGLVGFYTNSLWGFSYTKDVLIAILSGALIPINFFPEAIKGIVELLPFQTIFNVPIMLVTTSNLSWDYVLKCITSQLVWLIILFVIGRIIYARSIKALTVNGG